MRKNTFRRAAAALLGAAAVALSAPATTASADTAPEAWMAAGDKLMPGQTLKAGEAVLAMQADGNLVLRLEGPTGARGPEVWATGTWGHPGAYAFMQPDGNLVVYKQGSTTDALWSTGTWGDPGARLLLSSGELEVWGTNKHWSSDTGQFFHERNPLNVLPAHTGLTTGHWIQSKSAWVVVQPDGNAVLYRKRDGAALWSTGTYGNPGLKGLFVAEETFVPAAYLTALGSGNHKTFWSTPVNGRAGAYGTVQDDGNFVVYSGSNALWSTGTWGNG
ncbi:hypothetical protein [Kitasatospora sp. NPDC004531]